MKKKLLLFIILIFIGFIGSAQCPKPYQLSTNTKTTNSITLTWNSGNNALTGNFEIEYGPRNFSPGTGTKISSSYVALQINNLNSNTPYDFYVTNKCGSTPTTSDVYQDITIADYCNGDLFLDPGFNENYVGEHYESYNIRPNSPDQRIVLDFDVFELSPNATLKIWQGSYALGNPIAEYDNNSLPTEPITSKAANGELYVQFESNNSQNNAIGWVGKITCIDKPQCNAPRFVSPTSITYNSITLRWTKSTANRTFIEYGPKDFIMGTGEKVNTYSNTIEISSLNELTEYDFYLTEECEDLSLSDTNKIPSVSTKPFCESTISFRRLDAYKLNQIELTGVNIDPDLNEEWQLEYGLKGFTPGEGTTQNYASKDIILGNLENDTEYDFYLRNKCGDRFSSPKGPFSKKTNVDYCSEGKIYDRGGKDKIYTDYQYTRDKYIYLRDNTRARIKVNSIRLTSYEEIKIYDGPDSNSPLLRHLRRNLPPGEFVSSGNSNVIFFDIKNNHYNYSDIKWDIDITCEPTPNCEEATNFQVKASKLTHNQCELNWTKTSNLSDSYSIEYGLEGFERGTGTIVQTNEDFITLINLSKSTSYQAYITTVCAAGGQNNIYVEPLTFKTTPNYFGGDKFTDDGGVDNNIPENQTKITTIYPKDDGERIRITFDYIELMTSYHYNSLKIYSGTNTDSEPIVQLKTTSDFETKGYSFSSDDPNGAITIEYIGNDSYSRYFSRGWEADIISELIPDCSEPFNISTTNFTHQEINLTWESETDVSEWKIEYGPAGFIRGNGIVKDTNNENISITDLSPDTVYDFYISSKCGNGNFNDYAPVYKEKTRKDFSNGVLLTSNDEIRTIYPNNNGERIRIEFTHFNIEPYNQSTWKSEVVVNFLNELKTYNYYSCYVFNHDSNLYPVVSEKEDGSISYFQNIDGTSYWEAKVYSEPKPTCETTNEKEFLFQRVSHKEVELIWEKNDESTTYKVEYGPLGFTLGTGITKEFDSNRQFLESGLRRPYHTYNTENNRFDPNLIYYSIILDDLYEDTEYEFYITTICPDGFTNTFPVPKLIKTTANLVNTGIYHANSSGQMKQRKLWTIVGQLENTTIYPNSSEDRVVATIKRLKIPQYSGGDPFTVFNNNSTKDENTVLFSTNWEIPFIHDETVIKADNDSGCLTFNFSFSNSRAFGYIPETVESWWDGSPGGWIVEITSEPKNTLNVKDMADTKNIQLYPNPSKDHFFIKNNLDLDIKEISINDITGRSVKKYFNTNLNQKLDFNLPSGTYFVIIKTENDTASIKRIIVE
ncbi:fibronectin type III domain-containing protein [Flavivirga spongiicola]|uniref:T9SS type A sorting domain-containing protein n=1 Tax=Flavivirga spongiicola TaxID=421621 RepID=A0ABU7XXQ9_9FLAO|nr:T9SS type A sorting domain-containing protein [Flavivirga sp. MEBiC05379]MDO5980323.1 T9SS type A sorting domain-containing protein [Flavivirga sp. MEBiC05379]